jgi:ligand-binding sensor domain-containing protein
MFNRNRYYIKLGICLKLLLFFCIYAQAQSLFFDHLSIKEGLPHNTVYAVAQDREGFMWFGTHSGLVRYDGYNCINFQKVKNNKQEEIDLRTVHALLMDSNGLLWIGTESGELITYDTNKGEWSKVFENQEISSEVNAIFEDTKGRFWIATMANGCFLLDEKRQIKQRFDTKNSVLQTNSVFSFTADNQGNVWLVAAGNGLYVFDHQLNFISCDISPNESLASFRKCLFFDKDETLWIGVENDGLYLYDTWFFHKTDFIFVTI